MNVNAIRLGLVALLEPAGYQRKEYVPEDVVDTPAVIAGVPDEIDYGASLGLAQITLPLTLVFSAADLKEAQLKMDNALSTDDDNSAISLLLAAMQSPTDDWRSFRVVRADNIRQQGAGQSSMLGVDVSLEVLARK